MVLGFDADGREAPLQQATVGVGYSSNSGARVSLEHLHRHVFGQRATMRNKFEIGRLRRVLLHGK